MTSPPQEITIKCPKCWKVYEDWYRASVNLMLDDFDEDYIDECSSATCPDCGYKIEFDNLLVDKEGTFIVPGEEITNYDDLIQYAGENTHHPLRKGD